MSVMIIVIHLNHTMYSLESVRLPGLFIPTMTKRENNSLQLPSGNKRVASLCRFICNDSQTVTAALLTNYATGYHAAKTTRKEGCLLHAASVAHSRAARSSIQGARGRSVPAGLTPKSPRIRRRARGCTPETDPRSPPES